MNDVKAKNIDLHSSFMKMNTKNVAATKEGEKINRLPQSKLGLVVNVEWLFNPMAFVQPSIMTFWLRVRKSGQVSGKKNWLKIF